MTSLCQCGCGQPLGFRQRRFASRSCAGRGIPPEKRREGSRRGARVKAETFWAAMLRDMVGMSIEEKVRTAYWRGYSRGKQQRLRAKAKDAAETARTLIEKGRR